MKLLKSLFILLLAVPSFAAHSVTLSWTASPSAGVTQYRIYQSYTQGGPYKLFTWAPATVGVATIYTNPGALPLQEGATYYYVVTAFDGYSESVYSNEAAGTIPSAPQPPTGLKVVAK